MKTPTRIQFKTQMTLTALILSGLILGGCSAAPGQSDNSEIGTTEQGANDNQGWTSTPVSQRPRLTANQIQYYFPTASNNSPFVFQITNLSQFIAYDIEAKMNLNSSFTLLSNNCNRSELDLDENCQIQVGYENTSSTTQLGYITLTFKNDKGEAMSSINLTVKGPGVPAPTPSPTPSPSPSATPTPGAGTLYISSEPVFQKSTVSCGTRNIRDACPAGSTFDGANCYVGAAPWGKAFIYGGNFYYPPKAGTPCASGHQFDGANCVYAPANGPSPFIHDNNYYFKASDRSVEVFQAAECPRGSIFDGSACHIGNTYRGKAWIQNGLVYYPALHQAIKPCELNQRYDGTGCVYSNMPTGWTGFIWNSTTPGVYVEAKNRHCTQ